MEKFTPLAKILHCRRQWRHGQIPPLQNHHQHIRYHHQQHQGWYFGHGGRAISYVDKFLRTKFDALLAKKEKRYFHFLLSLAYPIDMLDWALFSVVILFHHLFPLLEKVEIRAFILPRNFPAVFIIFTGRGGAGNPPLPTARDGAGNPPSPRAGRPSLL